ncbi:hypothetical protein [Streptomyces xylophagus]|uniref:hypothetical protein n=1 Tax=Streptomyces xylophagus TaxID=285514 RepID=UPI000B248C26|nr:hypothetical protein [Streptomyces xylophagus]
MKRSSGIRLCVTVAVSALSLALITACSDSGSDDAKDSAKSSATSSAKALTAAELKKLIIAQGDAAGYKVAVEAAVPGGRSGITADEKCKPLLYVMSGLAPTDAPAEINRRVTADKKPSATASTDLEDMSDADIEKALTDSMSVDMTMVALSTYDGDGAEKALKAVSDAVAGCAGGFTGKAGGEEQKFTKVTAEKGSGAGDESVAYAAYGAPDETDGKISATHAEVVRHGNVVATYYTLNLGAIVADKTYTVPAAVITAQSAKLK